MTLSTTHDGQERHFTASAGTTTNPVHVFTDASRGRVSRRLYECPQLATLSDQNKSKAFFLCNEMSYGSIESTCKHGLNVLMATMTIDFTTHGAQDIMLLLHIG
jgi:hypothetical protein